MRLRWPTLIAIGLIASLPAAVMADTDSPRPLQTEASDGPVKVTARLNMATARVAEPIQLVLEVEAPKGAHIELPAKTDRLGAFEVRRTQQTLDIPSATQAGKRSWVMRSTLESLKAGELVVPSLEVHYTADAASSTFKTLATPPLKVKITSVLENRADPTKFRDLKQVIDVPVPPVVSRRWIVWTSGGLAGTVLACLLALAVVKRRRRGPSPATWALASIEELEQVAESHMARPESVFNEVVDVVREFFELEFNVAALPRTTREFLAEASNEIGLPEVTSKRLTWLASLADEIKFARLGIGEESLKQAFAQAKAFVNECEAHRLGNTKEAA